MTKVLLRPLLISLTFLILLSLVISPKVFAQDKLENVILGKNDTIDHDYFAGGNSVAVHGTVNGDAYVFGGSIDVDGVINGDLIAAGGTITISGEIKNDLRVGGGNIILDGKVGGNILAGAGTLTLSKNSRIGGSLIAGAGVVAVNSPLNKMAWIGAGQTRINSTLKEDANISSDELVLDTDAKISGNLNYWSKNQVQLLEGATVSGVVKHQEALVRRVNTQAFLGLALGFGLFAKIASTLSLLILGLLLLRFFPKKTVAVSVEIGKKPLASFGWGSGAAIISLFISLILMVTILGIPLAVLLIMSLGVGVYLATIFVALWLGRTLFANLDTSKKYYLAFFIGLILLQIISLLPLIGWLIKVIAVFGGLGALLRVKKATYQELKSQL